MIKNLGCFLKLKINNMKWASKIKLELYSSSYIWAIAPTILFYDGYMKLRLEIGFLKFYFAITYDK